MKDENHISLILQTWHLPAIRSVTRPSTGTINQTFIVDTDSGLFVLRCYRHSKRCWVEREHYLIEHAISRGLPALLPIPLPDGESILEHEQGLYALFPYASGSQLRRDELDAEHSAAMGIFLAQLHLALADFEHPLIQPRSYCIDTVHSLSQIKAYEQHIRSLDNLQASDGYALKRLADQRDWLEQHADLDIDDLSTLPGQTIHGDYTESNLFFQNGQVSAIIDWDQAYSAPPAWEIVRTLDLVFRFAARESYIFLDAYQSLYPLSLHDLDLAAHCYSIMRGHDLWIYAAIYDQHNERIRQFLAPGGFRDLLGKWEHVKKSRPQKLAHTSSAYA